MIKAVLTDLDGVVRRWDPGVIARAEIATGLTRDALLNTAFEPDLLLRATTGQIDDENWRSVVAERLRLRHPAADAGEAVRLWSLSPGEIDTDVLDLLLRCRENTSLALITNATTRLDADLKRLGIDQAFDHVVNSSSIGQVKPHPGIFIAALELLAIGADEAFFIDDRSKNVNAAIELGMDGHHYTTIERLKRALEHHGLQV
ncbi:MAG: HAD family phosphatase [Gemmatimonadetes bacterium]|nr:HAD family phosphatase [Gemmatimonadota bacterium]